MGEVWPFFIAALYDDAHELPFLPPFACQEQFNTTHKEFAAPVVRWLRKSVKLVGWVSADSAALLCQGCLLIQCGVFSAAAALRKKRKEKKAISRGISIPLSLLLRHETLFHSSKDGSEKREKTVEKRSQKNLPRAHSLFLQQVLLGCYHAKSMKSRRDIFRFVDIHGRCTVQYCVSCGPG